MIQTSVFWFDAVDARRRIELLTSRTPLEEDNIYTEKHHYLTAGDRVAKLFESEKVRNREYDPIYKALNQCLSALVYHRGSRSVVTSSQQRRRVLFTVDYPVILCNSFRSIYGTDAEEEASPLNLSENFLLEVNYAYVDQGDTRQREYFLIDVVNFETLDSYLECLVEDVEAMKILIREP